MTRLQKKCLIAAAGTHLLIVVVVLCSGFITPKPKVDDTQLLDVIPSTLIDAAMSSGVKSAQPPPPTPITKPPEPIPPTPEPPKPEVKPQPQPKPEPEPVKQEELKPVEKPDVEIPKPKPPKKHEIKIDLTKKVTRDNEQAKQEAAEAAAKAEKDAKRIRDQKLKAFQNAARSIKENSSTSTTVEMPGAGSVSYANYASVVKSIYERAWTPPDDTASDDANVKVSVTIAADGRVIESHVVDASGDAKVDGSIRRTLDRVTFIAPFPEGAKEKERTFKINFNLKAKRLLG
ncbi:MAG: TonB terminal [Verrucomicrobiota bacterium]